jgi:hypothetical protein
MSIHFKTLVLLIGLAASALSNAQSPAPGTYIYEGGGGTLNIHPNQTFDLNTVGGNAHLCGLSGQLTGPNSALANSQCVVTIAKKGYDLQVSTNGDASCRDFCGMRAGFEGLYIRPSGECTASAVTRARKEFKMQYDHKQYASAVQTLEPLLTLCARVLNWQDERWMRNDLALAQLRSGNAAVCRKTLEPLQELSNMSDDEIRAMPEPAYTDTWLAIAKATRTNRKLCAPN